MAVDGHKLAVDQRRALRQSLKRRNDYLELLCPIMAVARVDHNIGARYGSLGTIAVELYLEEPISAYGYGVGEGAELEGGENAGGV